MQVAKAIKLLKRYSENDHVIIAWWDKDAFEGIGEEDWEGNCDWVEDQMDWSDAHDEMSTLFEY